MMAHLAAAGCEFFIPLFGFIGPAIVWALRRDDRDVVWHARQALFFQLGTSLVCWSLAAVGAVFSCAGVGWLFWLMALPPALGAVVIPLLAAARVSNGDDWSYPVTGRLMRKDPDRIG